MSYSEGSYSAAVGPSRAGIRTWRWTASVMGLVAVVGFVVAACGGGGNRTSKATSSTSTSLVSQQQGAQIFQAKCASCHDAKLAGQVTRDFPNVDDEIAVVTNGRASSLETMPSFAGVLTTAQIRDVVEYTRVQLGK
jgi:mono/diheme cytochrome c family protein